jgi:hypothetical protein
MAPLAEQVKVEITQLGREQVGVVLDLDPALVVIPVDQILAHHLLGRTSPFEKVAVLDAHKLDATLVDPHSFGPRQKDSDDHVAIAIFMAAEHRKRVVMARLDDALQRLCETR